MDLRGCGTCRRESAPRTASRSFACIASCGRLRRVEQHDLVVLDDEAREKRGVVRRPAPWSETARPAAAEPCDDALRARHRLVVEEMLDDARRPAPSARAAPGASACVPGCRGRSRSCSSSGPPPPPTGTRPARRTSSTECRRRGRVSTSARLFSLPGASHLLAYQRADLLADLRFADLERQQALRPDRRLDFLCSRRAPASRRTRSSARRGRDRRPRPPCSSGTARCASRSASRAASSGSSRSACDEIELDDRAGRASTANGDSVPQNGQTSFCFAGFHSACAPHAGHAMLLESGDCRSSEPARLRLTSPRYSSSAAALDALASCRSSCPPARPTRGSPSRRLRARRAPSRRRPATSSSGSAPRPPPAAAPAPSAAARDRCIPCCCIDLLRDRQADRQLRRHAAGAAAALLHALRHLELHVVVQVADRRHARALVDRLLDLRRHRHVLDDEARRSRGRTSP